MLNVNGITVHTDKAISSIVGSRIDFVDGSWCDVSNGIIVNNGSGYISLGGNTSVPGTQSSKEPIKLGPKIFKAQILGIERVDADIEILPNVEDDMIVFAVGDQAFIDSLEMETVGGVLRISSRRPSGSVRIGNIIADSIIVSGSVVVGSSISVGSSDRPNNKITIHIPKRRRIILHVSGRQVINIGDVEADLMLEMSGSGLVKAESLSRAHLSMSGSGRVQIKRLTGKMEVANSGSSSVKVEEANIPALNASLSGSGSLRVSGTVGEAFLETSGSGSINIDRVTGNLNRRRSGSGSIQVERRG